MRAGHYLYKKGHFVCISRTLIKTNCVDSVMEGRSAVDVSVKFQLDNLEVHV